MVSWSSIVTRWKPWLFRELQLIKNLEFQIIWNLEFVHAFVTLRRSVARASKHEFQIPNSYFLIPRARSEITRVQEPGGDAERSKHPRGERGDRERPGAARPAEEARPRVAGRAEDL